MAGLGRRQQHPYGAPEFGAAFWISASQATGRCVGLQDGPSAIGTRTASKSGHPAKPVATSLATGSDFVILPGAPHPPFTWPFSLGGTELEPVTSSVSRKLQTIPDLKLCGYGLRLPEFWSASGDSGGRYAPPPRLVHARRSRCAPGPIRRPRDGPCGVGTSGGADACGTAGALL